MMFIPAIQPNEGFEWTQAPWGATLRCTPLARVAPHLFTARNLELRSDPGEWGGIAAVLGVTPEDLLLIHQVHGRNVAVARRDRSGIWVRPEADVIVSHDPSAAVGVRVADCAPILLADPRTGTAGAAHAGWRGSVRRAAVAAVESMTREFGARPRDIIAAIGPCLGPCCGEVGDDVVQAFRDAGHDGAHLQRWFTRGHAGKPHLDLWTANRDQLESAGVLPENVHVAGLCTKTYASTFHSYRAQGPTAGRMLAAIRPGNCLP